MCIVTSCYHAYWDMVSAYPLPKVSLSRNSSRQDLKLVSIEINCRVVWCMCVCGGGGGGGAYPHTKRQNQLQNDEFAFKLGNNVHCYQLFPTLTESSKTLTTLTAYKLALLLRIGGNKTLKWYA